MRQGRSFDAMQFELAESIPHNGSDGLGHQTSAGKFRTHPIAKFCRLSHAASNARQRNSTRQLVVGRQENAERVAKIFGSVPLACFDPQAERGAREREGRVAATSTSCSTAARLI